MLAIFGVLFTAFALLQSYLNFRIVKIISPSNDNNQNIKKANSHAMQMTNKNFALLLMVMLIDIIILILSRFIVVIMPNSFLLFANVKLCNLICFFIILFIFSLTLYCIASIKSIVRDLYMLFKMGLFVEIVEKEK